MNTPANQPTFVDSPDAPEIFADNASGTFWKDGVLRVTLETLRVNHAQHPGPLNRVVVGRLVMPIAGAENLAKLILDAVEKSRAQTPASEPQTVSRAH